MLLTNSTSGYVSMYFLFSKTTKYWKVNLELGYMTLGYSIETKPSHRLTFQYFVIFGEKQLTSQPVCHQYKNEWLTLTYKSSFFTALLLSVYVQCVSTKIINDPKLTAAPRLPLSSFLD